MTEDEKTEAYRELIAKKRAEPHRFYVPNQKMEEFLNTMFSGKYFIGLCSAANGFGKTTGFANLLANMAFPCGNPYFQQPLLQKWPYLKRGRIASDPTTITQAIIPALHQWFPKGRYTTEKRGKSYESYWKTDTGWEFDILSYEQSTKEFESATLGWCWMDEPPPEDRYKATVFRMRAGGMMWIGATPLKGSGWMYDQIAANKDNEEGQRFYMTASVYDACRDRGVRGHLMPEAIDRMVAQTNAADRQARVWGQFQHLVGRVFKEFNREIHTCAPFPISMEDYVVVEFLDPHPRTPDAILWMAIDKFGRKFVVDELSYDGKGEEELAAQIQAKASRYRVIGRWIDPSWTFSTGKHEGSEALSLVDKLARYGLNYLPAPKKREEANRRIHSALHCVVSAGRLMSEPELRIFSTCDKTIWEIENWTWQEHSSVTEERRGKSEKPVDKNDHFIENLGRALYIEPQWEPMPSKVQRRADPNDLRDPLRKDLY